MKVLVGIGLALLSAQLILSAATGLNCTIPEIPDEGCGACYSYNVSEVPTGEIELVETGNIVVDFMACEDYLENFGLIPDESICVILGYTMMETVNVSIVETVCTVDTVALYEVCLSASERVFIVASPTPYPNNTICYWNIPEPESGIYLSLTARGIRQVSDGCDDRLMIQSDAWSEDLVTCGNSQGLPAVINNDFMQSGIETFFVSNAMDAGVGFEMLVAYYDPPVGKRDTVIFPGTSNHTADIWASRHDTAATAEGCSCRALDTPITTLCSSASLNNNPYYTKYIEVMNSIPDGAAHGFNGYKGCPGAEFFRCGSSASVSSLTVEECETFRLGMTPQEAEDFLVLGEAMWNGYIPINTCGDTTATRPDPHELVQLHLMVYGPNAAARAAECVGSDNPILQTVADHIAGGNIIWYMRPQ